MIDETELEAKRAKAREASRRYRERHPGRAAANVKKWRDNNLETARERRREAYWKDPEKERQAKRDYDAANPGNHRASHLMRNYGLSLDDFNDMADAQGYKCAICGTEVDGNLYVDHDHDSGEVRGLLCDLCNRGLGYFKDNIASLANAITYLSKYREV